ncbi:MAG: glycoside hydrolase family 25 protein [Lachnospiraceae bacterium]|nr:glycoside hydrolase family 25 protein [Lachnospiraceae bacterium]
MGFKRFWIIAVAAAFLVVAAFFVLMLNAFQTGKPGDTGAPETAAVSEEERKAEGGETGEGYSDLKTAGIESTGAEDGNDEKDEGKKQPSDDDWPYLNLLISSVNRDIKIMITLRDGSLVTGVPFRAEISKGDKVSEYEDSDKDGIITASDLPGGKYTIHLKHRPGFIGPDDSSVTVRSDISYQKVDYIRTLIKTEDQVDAEAEDTADIEEEDDGALLNAGEIDLARGTIGIDVSKYNKDIDWAKVKDAGIEYAIIRMGYRGSSTGALVEDPYYERNVKGAKDAGLKIGVYFFTQALNETEAIEEASMVESLITAEELTLPVFLDVESAGGRGDLIDPVQRTANIKAFIETLENAGYKAGLYANKTWLNKKMNAGELSEYPIWLAQYKVRRPTYEGRYDMWQYSSKGHVEGIEGYVDLNLNISL